MFSTLIPPTEKNVFGQFPMKHSDNAPEPPCKKYFSGKIVTPPPQKKENLPALLWPQSFKYCFVYRRIHSKSFEDWLSILDKENVPVLICLTFADKLFAELMGENENCDVEKIVMEQQLNVCIPYLFHF